MCFKKKASRVTGLTIAQETALKHNVLDIFSGLGPLVLLEERVTVNQYKVVLCDHL